MKIKGNNNDCRRHVYNWLTVLPVVICVLIMSLIQTACEPKPNDSSDLRAFTDTRWIYGDDVEFLPIMTDSVTMMDVVLLLRHGNGYEYSNIWLEVSRPYGEDVIRDTFNITLADNSGKWYGSGLGLTFQIEDTIYRNVEVYRDKAWRIRHIMRCDTLENIEQIGLGFDQRP